MYRAVEDRACAFDHSAREGTDAASHQADAALTDMLNGGVELAGLCVLIVDDEYAPNPAEASELRAVVARLARPAAPD